MSDERCKHDVRDNSCYICYPIHMPEREEAALEFVKQCWMIEPYKETTIFEAHLAGQTLGEQRAIEKVCEWLDERGFGTMIGDAVRKRFLK